MAPKKRTTRSSPATTTPTTTPMTDEQLRTLIAQGVADVLAERDATRSRNGENSHDSGTDVKRQAPLARECTYSDFIKCKPLYFKGTEGVVELTQWFERMKIVFRISNCIVKNQIKFATCTLLGSALMWWNSHVSTVGHDVAYAMSWTNLKKKMTDKYYPRGEIKKLEVEMWNLKVKGTNVVSYNQLFQELALICARMFPEESDKNERYVGGLPDMINGSVMASKPKTMQDAIEFTTKLMDKKINTLIERQDENKRKLDNNNQAQQQPPKKQGVAISYTDGPGERKEYAGTLPLCNKCKFYHNGQYTERYKDLLRACPHHGFTELYQLDTFYNTLNPEDQDSLNVAAGGNLLEKSPQDALTIIENKSKVKAVEEICVTCGGAHPYYQCLAAGGNTFLEYRDNIQDYVSAATGNYNQGNPGYRPQGVANQMRPPATQSNQNFHLNELEKIKRMNDVSLKAMQNQIDMVKNELRNEMKTSIQTSLSNQTNEIKNMMASLLQMNTASTSGSETLPGNTIANPKGELKAITTHSGLVTEGPTVPNPPKPVNPKEDACVEETYPDPDHAEYNIKVPPPPSVQKPKPPIQINFVLHARHFFLPRIPYPSQMLKQKQQEKDDIQI
nr:hypothetical protein [Tanacetum cinerariifolium]